MGLEALALEAAASVGGTSYANRYPGARVDIQSLDYSFSFSEELQQEWRWTERYASQPQLLCYANHVADRFGLRRRRRGSTPGVTRARFDEAAQTLARREPTTGGRWTARFVIMATGPLSAPNTPAFEGLATFAGEVLHSAHTGLHEPVDFTGRRVGGGRHGLVGRCRSSRRSRGRPKSLTVFQRTAAYVVPSHNGPLDPAHEARIKADYAGHRARNRQMRIGFNSEIPTSLPIGARGFRRRA